MTNIWMQAVEFGEKYVTYLRAIGILIMLAKELNHAWLTFLDVMAEAYRTK